MPSIETVDAIEAASFSDSARIPAMYLDRRTAAICVWAVNANPPAYDRYL